VRRIRSGVVSVVLVNFKGTDDTLTSIRALAETDWPADLLEIIVVENGSGEEYAAPLRESELAFRLIETGANLGFTGGCNRGVAEATGEYIAFLNNDARPDRSWIRAAVETFERDNNVGAVASKVLDWEGVNIDFTEAAVTWYGMGYKPHAGGADTGEWESERDVLFGTGAAMFIRAGLFDDLGGFDDRYFMFYDDVDLGWRLNLLGWTFRYQPASIAYHKHHASMKGFGEFRETYLLERNALFTLYKNLGDSELDRVLPGALALAVRRAVARGDLDSTELDLRRRGDDRVPGMPVAKVTMAGVFAIDQFVEMLPSLAQTRSQIQSSRRRSDRDLRALFGKVDEPAYPISRYLDGYARILNALEPTAFHNGRRIVVIVDGAVSEREIAIAHTLALDHDVRVVGVDCAHGSGGIVDYFDASSASPEGMAVHEEWAQVCIVPIGLVAVFPSLRASSKAFVLDIAEDARRRLAEQPRGTDDEDLDRLVRDADFVVVQSVEARRWWNGLLLSSGRTTSSMLRGGPQTSRMIALMPPSRRAEPQIPRPIDDPAVVIWDGSAETPGLTAAVQAAIETIGANRVTVDNEVGSARIVDASDQRVVVATEALLRAIESGTPMVAIGSGPLADLVRSERVGIVIAEASALAAAIEAVLFDTAARAEYASNLASLRAGMEGDQGIGGLADFCLRPTRGGRATLAPAAPPTAAAVESALPVPAVPSSPSRRVYRRVVPARVRGRISRWRQSGSGE